MRLQCKVVSRIADPCMTCTKLQDGFEHSVFAGPLRACWADVALFARVRTRYGPMCAFAGPFLARQFVCKPVAGPLFCLKARCGRSAGPALL